jgi:iron complex transport system substrate-binding protein
MAAPQKSLIGAALLALLVAAAASVAPAGAVQPQPIPKRIISAIPAVTEMLFAVGAGPQVVAVGSYDSYPPEARKLPKVGALLDPDVERILSLRPDLVFVYSTQTDLERQLKRARVPVFEYRHAGLPGVMQTIRAVGARTGHPEEGERIAAGIERDLAGIARAVAGRARPRTLLVFGREQGSLRGIYASGGVGFLHDMLVAAGGENVYADVKQESVQASTEAIIARQPDVILEIRSSESPTPFGSVEHELNAWKALSSVPAVRNGRVSFLIDDRIVIPGPRVAQGTRLIARALHPEAFQ